MKRKIRRFICTAMIFIMAVTSFDCTGMPGKVQAADNENDYPAVLALALDFFDENACGGDVGTLGVSWRGNCHTYDNEAALDKADNFPEQYRSLVDPDGDGKVDVSGGYHDAGDHVKFNLTMGFAGSSLALSEYLNPGVYEKAGAKAHLLKIVKRNADYLMKTTFLDGNGDVAAVCHVVGNGNTDHSIWSSPESQTYERTTYWLNAERNNTAVCCEMAAAIASAGWLYKDTDAEYTAKCVKYAKALLKFGKEHQGNDLGGLSTFYNTDGYYGSETMYGLDETAMAEAWLWVLGEGEKPGYTPDSGCYIYQGVYYGDYDFYSWNKVWQGFAALMYKAAGDQAYAQALKDAYTNKQGLSASYYNDFGIEWGVSRYNCAMQMTALALANKDASSDYAKAAKYQMDYILGANTYNYSFVIGYGTNPKYIHHRAANPDQAEAKYVLKGALLGGPDKNGYKDDVHSYQYTESALDYSGCLALACAGLAELYGGSGSTPSPEDPKDITQCTYDPDTATLYLAGQMYKDINNDKNTVEAALNRASVSKNDVKHIIALEGAILPSNCNSLFSGFAMAQDIDLAKVDSTGVTDMRMMFTGCASIKKLDLSMLDTTNVDRSNGYLRMLTDCKSLEEVTFGGKFNTAGAQKLTSFFSGCESLKTVDMTKFSTAGAWDISHMFNGCSSLTDLDTAKMSIASVDGRGMAGLFTGCSSLTELDLSNWSTGSISIMANLFSGCSSLKTIYVGEGWRVGQVSESPNMFSGCVNLVGGMGTVFDPEKTDKTYACIDQGEVSPGYLTRKGEAPEKKELTTVAVRCDATLKLDDGSYYRTYTYTGEPVIPKEIWVYERYSSSTSYKFMEASDYYKVITDNIEPGNGKITVYPTEYGRYTFEPVTLEFPIGKAKMYADKVKEAEAVFGSESSVSIDSLVEKGGTPGEIKVTDNNGIFDGTPVMEGSIVSFKIKDDEALTGKTASIRIPVSESDHYKPYDILIQIKVTKAPTVWADSVSISHTELSISINESFKLEAHILPENVTHPEIKWSSGNSLIASVNEEGLVTGLKEGTAKIYAASLYESSKWAECLVTVYDPSKGEPPTPAPEEPTPEEPAPTPSDPLPGGSSAKDPQPELTNEKEQSITLVKGQKFLFSDKDWKSSNKKVVSVSGKTVTAKKPGNAVLAFGTGEEAYKINITVIAPQIAKNEKKQKLSVGQSAQLKLSGVTAADGSIIFTGNEPMDILFYSSAPDVALVDDSGNINAMSKGSATITAYINSVAFKWTVKVSEDTAPKERTLHINVGKSKAVKIKGIKNTEWTVSGDNIVQIKKAKITAKEVGETTLTCEDHVLHVFVEDPSISGSSKPYKQQLSLDTGAEHPIELARIYQEVQFKSSKPVVAFADEYGVIHARSKGKTNITAKVNGKAVTIKLTVK